MTEEEKEHEHARFVIDFINFCSIAVEHNENRVFTHKTFEEACNDASEEYRRTYED